MTLNRIENVRSRKNQCLISIQNTLFQKKTHCFATIFCPRAQIMSGLDPNPDATVLVGNGHCVFVHKWKSENLTDYLVEDGTFPKVEKGDFLKIIGKITENHILVSDFSASGANWQKSNYFCCWIVSGSD